MSNEYLKKFSEELKKHRKKSKLSIDQIYTKTRIDKKYLTAIEEGNFSILPDVYIRAFIKEYSSAIGLSPTEILSKYEMVKKGLDFAEPQEISQKTENNSVKTVGKKISDAAHLDSKVDNTLFDVKSNKTMYYALAGVLLLVLIFVIYNSIIIDNNNQIITEKPFEEIIKSQNKDDNLNEISKSSIQNSTVENEDSKITPKKKELVKVKKEAIINNISSLNKTLSQFSNTPLVLQIIGSDKSWIRIVTDEKDNTEFIIDRNITKVLGAQNKFYLHIGNSGGIKLLLNNRDLNFSGASGKVRKIFVTKDGIEYLKRTPVGNAEG